MNFTGFVSCIYGRAIVVLRRFRELSAGFGESDLVGGQGIVHLLLFIFSLVATVDCVCSLTWELDRCAANIFENAAKSIRAATPPKLL